MMTADVLARLIYDKFLEADGHDKDPTLTFDRLHPDVQAKFLHVAEAVLAREGGDWPPHDLRRVFVEGAAWWEYEQEGATIWKSDRAKAEAEAEKRYPGGKP